MNYSMMKSLKMHCLNLHIKDFYISFILAFSIAVPFSFFGQADPFMRLGSGVYSLGSATGIQPNYQLGKGSVFFHGTINQNITIKNVPLTFSGRLSTEPYISGRASFFRISYDANTAQKNRMEKLQIKRNSFDSLLHLNQDSLYKLQQKVSYFKLKELEALRYPEMNLDSINGNVAIPHLDSISAIHYPIDYSLKSVDSISNIKVSKPGIPSDLEKYEKLLQLKMEQIDKLEKEKLEIDTEYADVAYKLHFPLLQGLKKVDLGLTSLSKSNFSKNTLPVRGAHVSGVYKKFNYDFASGFSFPNQLFSSQVIDQVLLNSSNVFNLTSFFKVDNVRFVNSGIVEYGEKGRNSIYVEDFYTGRSFNQIVHSEKGERSNASNVGGYYTPQFLPNLTIAAASGMCRTFNDSIKRSFSDQSNQNASVEWRFSKLNGSIQASYKRIGSAYKGFSQGIYLNGFETKEIQYKQKIGKRLSTRLSGSESKFQARDSSSMIRFMRQGTVDLNLKIGRQSLMYFSGTLIDSKSDTSNLGLSYLIKSGLVLNKSLRKTNWNTTLDYTSALIRGGDSIQEIENYSVKTGLKFKHFYFGVKGTYQDYAGLNRVYGVNKTLQPEIGITYDKLEVRFTYQYLQSEQFGEDNGLTALFNFRPSAFFAWQISVQRWTKSELNFFINEIPGYIKPWYMNINAIITLK